MDDILIRAPAKINLRLDVLYKRDDGFHEIDSIMQSVSLHDTITVSKNETGIINVTANNPDLPCDINNLAYKAALAFFNENCYLHYGVNIAIKKNIPVGAGLAGGSTDAAAVLIAMNKLFMTSYSTDKLCAIGKSIGSDVPFCIIKGTARAKGRGELLESISYRDYKNIVIAIGNESVSTKLAYDYLDTYHLIEKYGASEDFYDPDDPCYSSMFNVFEKPVSNLIADVDAIKKIMKNNNSQVALMSGSGPSVFGIFDNERDSYNALTELSGKGYRAFYCSSVNNSFI